MYSTWSGEVELVWLEPSVGYSVFPTISLMLTPKDSDTQMLIGLFRKKIIRCQYFLSQELRDLPTTSLLHTGKQRSEKSELFKVI